MDTELARLAARTETHAGPTNKDSARTPTEAHPRRPNRRARLLLSGCVAAALLVVLLIGTSSTGANARTRAYLAADNLSRTESKSFWKHDDSMATWKRDGKECAAKLNNKLGRIKDLSNAESVMAEFRNELSDTRLFWVGRDDMEHSSSVVSGKARPGQETEQLKRFAQELSLERGHKNIRIANRNLFLFPDNTVVVSASKACRVDAIFFSKSVGAEGEENEYHPHVKNMVASNLHVAEDKSKHRPATTCFRGPGDKYFAVQCKAVRGRDCQLLMYNFVKPKKPKKRRYKDACKDWGGRFKAKRCLNNPHCRSLFCYHGSGPESSRSYWVPCVKHGYPCYTTNRKGACQSAGGADDWTAVNKKCPSQRCNTIGGKCPDKEKLLNDKNKQCNWNNPVGIPVRSTAVSASRVLKIMSGVMSVYSAVPRAPGAELVSFVGSVLGFAGDMSEGDPDAPLHELEVKFTTQLNKLRSCVDARFWEEKVGKTVDMMKYIRMELLFGAAISQSNDFAKITQFFEDVENKCFGIMLEHKNFPKHGKSGELDNNAWAARVGLLADAPNSVELCVGMYTAYIMSIVEYNSKQNCKSPKAQCFSTKYVAKRMQYYATQMVEYMKPVLTEVGQFYERKDVCGWNPKLVSAKLNMLSQQVLRPALISMLSVFGFIPHETFNLEYMGFTTNAKADYIWLPKKVAHEQCVNYCIAEQNCKFVAVVGKKCLGYKTNQRIGVAWGPTYFYIIKNPRVYGTMLKRENVHCVNNCPVYKRMAMSNLAHCQDTCRRDSKCVAATFYAYNNWAERGVCLMYQHGYLSVHGGPSAKKLAGAGRSRTGKLKGFGRIVHMVMARKMTVHTGGAFAFRGVPGHVRWHIYSDLQCWYYAIAGNYALAQMTSNGVCVLVPMHFERPFVYKASAKGHFLMSSAVFLRYDWDVLPAPSFRDVVGKFG